jgi:hypothetical protein
MTKTLADYRKENYLISSYCAALQRHWCMNTSCSTCGAMDLRNQLFQHALGNKMSDDAIKELRRTTKFYPRTADLPKEVKNKVLLSHILEFNNLETNEIDYVNSLIIEEIGITTYHEGFKEFIRFVVMDFWDSLEDIFSRADKLAELKRDITSQEVLKVIDDMNEHYLSRG